LHVLIIHSQDSVYLQQLYCYRCLS